MLQHYRRSGGGPREVSADNPLRDDTWRSESASMASDVWDALHCARPGAGATSSSCTSTRSKGGAETAAHLLTFDSVHGRWNARHRGRAPIASSIDGQTLTFSERSRARRGRWTTHGVDLVLECTGKFRTTAHARPVLRRAACKKVIVAAPVKEGALNIVVGVNDHLYEPSKHHLVTAASCTTNCLAPVVKVIHEAIGIDARRDHDDPRHHEHAGGDRCAAQGSPARSREQPVADSDEHRLGDRDRAHLSRAERQARTASRCACRCSTRRSRIACSR